MNFTSVKETFSYLLVILATPGQRKHAYRWLRSLKRNYLLDAKVPWITFDATDFLAQWLRQIRNPKVFEWGSGGSSLFWLKYNAAVVSIEHERKWFDLIHKRISASGNIDYRLVPPVKETTVGINDLTKATITP